MSWSSSCPSLIRKAGLGGLLAFSLAISAGAVSGQDPVERVNQFAEEMGGLTLIGDVETGSLPARRQLTYPIQLEGGQGYMVIGFCDGDCDDLDLVLLDLMGNELESDLMLDAEPVLLFTPEETGQFEVRVDMVNCSVEPCSYAIGVFEGEVDDVLGMVGETMEERMAFFREDLISEGFTETGTSETGGLKTGQELRYSVSLIEGMEYQLVGVCDNDCEDMDLAVFDPSGTEVNADRLPDAVPVLAFTATSSGPYRIAVHIVSCSLEPCSYEVATFIKGEGLAPGGVYVSGTIISEATHRGTLEAGDEQLREGEYYDEYSIDAEVGQTVIVDLRSPDFDTYLIVESPGGESERNDDWGDDAMHSHIEMVAQENGTFSILVTTFSAEATGAYTLQLAVVEGT